MKIVFVGFADDLIACVPCYGLSWSVVLEAFFSVTIRPILLHRVVTARSFLGEAANFVVDFEPFGLD